MGRGVHGIEQGDRGVATVVTCLAVAALLVITALALRMGGATIAAQRAGAAADLGALAGAAVVLQGSAAACARAGRVVAANHAALVGCEVLGFDVRVHTAVDVAVGPIGSGRATGRARAGPDR